MSASRRPSKGRAARDPEPAASPAPPPTKAPAARSGRRAAQPKPPAPPKRTGRPPSPKFAAKRDEILTRLAGGEELTDILRDSGMPTRSTVYLRLVTDEAFSDAHARARKAWAFAKAEECVGIADDSSEDVRVIFRPDGRQVEVPNTEYMQRSRLRVETRMRLIARFHPKQFGEKVDVTSDGKPLESGVMLLPAMDPRPSKTPAKPLPAPRAAPKAARK